MDESEKTYRTYAVCLCAAVIVLIGAILAAKWSDDRTSEANAANGIYYRAAGWAK
jgi:hypothetical protein